MPDDPLPKRNPLEPSFLEILRSFVMGKDYPEAELNLAVNAYLETLRAYLLGVRKTIRAAKIVAPSAVLAFFSQLPKPDFKRTEEIVLGHAPMPARLTPALNNLLSRDPYLAQTAEEAAATFRAGGISFARAGTTRVTQHVQEVIGAAMEAGVPGVEGRDIVAQATGWTKGYAETAYRTTAMSAYTGGTIDTHQKPFISSIFPGFEVIGSNDADTRRGRPEDRGENHLATLHLVAETNDPIWQTHTPPFGFSCVAGDTRVSGRTLAITRSLYEGPMVEVLVGGGTRLCVTVNHPIPTSSGWKPAHLVGPGDRVLRDRRVVDALDRDPRARVPGADVRAHDDKDVPPTAEEVFRALSLQGVRVSCRQVLPDDFDGDGSRMQGDVEVVAADSQLLGRWVAARTKALSDLVVVEHTGTVPDNLNTARGSASSLLAVGAPGLGGPGSSGDPVYHVIELPGFSCALPAQFAGIGPTARLDSALSQACDESGARDPCFASNLQDRFPREVAFDEVVEVRYLDASPCHVYDLITDVGWFTANSIAVSNCRHTLRSISRFEAKDRGWLNADGRLVRQEPPDFADYSPKEGFGGKPAFRT